MKFLMMLLLSFSAWGAREGNGGDECEREIKMIRSEIQSWIARKGHSALRFKDEMTPAEYAQKMTKAMEVTHIECTDKDIEVRGKDKTCWNYYDDKTGYHMECNYDRFLALSNV